MATFLVDHGQILRHSEGDSYMNSLKVKKLKQTWGIEENPKDGSPRRKYLWL